MKIEEIVTERGYEITKDGNVFNPKGRKVGMVNKEGYMKVSIRLDKKTVHFFAHRLQAFKKYGQDLFESGIVARHLNGNSLDNSWDNIAIGTHSDNMMDIPEDVRIKKAFHASSFLKKYDNEDVIEFYNACRSYKQTMEKFNISSKGTLNYILRQKK